MSNLLSHNDTSSRLHDLEYYKERLMNNKNLILPVNEEIKLLEQLYKTEIGRFLLANKGLNGYWTAYLILHGYKKNDISDFENWFLNKSPTILATRERFYIFQEQLQKRIRNNISIASIPCGMMDDLLGLDYTGFKSIRLYGIDLDMNSIELAKSNAENYKCSGNLTFYNKDAYELDGNEQYDIIASNGLNIYESDQNNILKLYKNLYNSLKQDGVLITSFLTPPPALSKKSPWVNYNITDATKQTALFKDIIETKWQNFTTEKEINNQLLNVGFKNIDFIYDSQCMFPTVVAMK